MVFNKANLTIALTLAANILAEEMRRVTSVRGEGGYPPQVPASITVNPAIVTDTEASIAISTNENSKDAVAITLAYELGSGKFGPRGVPYKIEGNPLLAFPVSEWDAYMEPPPKPKLTFVFPEITHPGIRPIPFVINSIHAVEDRMMEILSQNFTLEIFEGPRVEYIK